MMIAEANSSEPWTITGARMLGNTVLRRIRVWLLPIARAAST